jgi:ElaB/YqjD/DUF883 family membrane-anchored ribosome-binding protein
MEDDDARAELDAVTAQLWRLSEAGVVTGEHRETLRTIASRLQDIRRRLGRGSTRNDAVVETLVEVAEQVDDLARTHPDCVYGPVLAQFAQRLTDGAKGLVG